MKNEERKQAFLETMSMFYDFLCSEHCHCEHFNGEAEVENKPVSDIEKPIKEANAEELEEIHKVNRFTANFSADDLIDMSYANLKKLCADCGVSAKGNRDALIKRLTEIAVEVDEESIVDPESEGFTEIEDEPEEDFEDSEIVKQVENATKDMETSEIADILSSIGRRTKGKRQALLEELIEAVKEGEVVLNDTKDAKVEEALTKDAVDDTSEVDEDEESSQDDAVDDTPERAEAVSNFRKSMNDAFDAGNFESSELYEWYAEYNNTSKKEAKKVDIRDIFEMYMDKAIMYIDDEGTEHDEKDAYVIRGEAYCCGELLFYDEEKEEYVCHSCGSRWDAD